MDEQVEPRDEEITQDQDDGQEPEISSILGDALKDKAGSPEDAEPTEEDQAEEQVETVDTPFGEITLDEAKKIAFKDEKEFQAFVEKNPFLKDKILMQSDYTRKTQALADERKKFEELKGQFDTEQEKQASAWGKEKPSDEEMSFFHTFWHLFKYGSDDLAGRLHSIAQDVNLISQGKSPVGPMKGENGQAIDFSRDSELIKMRKDFDEYRRNQERKEKEYKTQLEQREYDKMVSEVNSWLSSKDKSGVKITQEELNAMARFSSLKDDQGKPITLDDMYRLALAQLGKSEKETIKKTIVSAKQRSRQTPSQPTSRVPSNAQPDAESIDDILKQGQEALRS